MSKSASAAVGLCHADEGDADAARLREELQHRRGDDAERALGADEEVLEVVAGVVLAERPEAVPDLAGGQHHLERRAPARAYCRRRARRCRRHWSRGCRRSGTSLPRRATAGRAGRPRRRRRCASARMTPASTVMVLPAGSTPRMRLSRDSERTISLPALRPGSARRRGRYCRPAARSRVPRLVGELQDRRDLGHRARPQHQRRPAAEQPAQLDQIGRDRLRHRGAHSARRRWRRSGRGGARGEAGAFMAPDVGHAASRASRRPLPRPWRPAAIGAASLPPAHSRR